MGINVIPVFHNRNRFLGKLSLVLTPAFFLMSELLHPVSQTETAKELESVARNYAAWEAAHLLALAAIIFLPFALLYLIEFINKKNMTLGYAGYALAQLGLVSVAGFTAFDLIVLQIGAKGTSPEMIALYDRIVQTPGFSIPFLTIGPLCLVIGIATIAAALYRSAVMKRWKTVLLLIGILLYGLAGPLIPVDNGHLIVIFGAFLMLLGLGGIFFEPGKKQ